MSVVEGHYDKLEREAAEKLSAALALPLPETRMYIGGEENWRLSPLPTLMSFTGNCLSEAPVNLSRETWLTKRLNAFRGFVYPQGARCLHGGRNGFD